jgi:LysR family transcriptional regulator, nitrogen assimilation regulatory protein
MPTWYIIGRMNLKQLRTFVRVGELGSLSKAADRLRIAQPALSRQMSLLQAEIGVPLFERHRRGMQLTPAGRDLMERVSGLIRQLDLACEDVRASAGDARGAVVFGLVPTVSSVLAARLALRVASEFPRVSLRIVESFGGHQMDWLQRGEVDAAIVYGSHSRRHMPAEELLEEELVVVGPPDCKLGAGTPLPIAEVAALPLVLPSRFHGLRILAESAAAKVRGRLSVRFETDSFRVLVALVEIGLGYTILPLSAVSREIEDRRLKYAPLVQPKVTRQLILCTPATPISRATRTVIQLARAEITSLVRSGAWRAKLQFTLRPSPP